MGGKHGRGGGFRKFLWNSETKEFCGRTGLSWLKIFIFYVIFYLSLAAFFGLMLYIFFLTMDSQTPKYEGAYSLLGENPGMGVRPRPDVSHNVEHSIIWYKRNNLTAKGKRTKGEEIKFWVKQLEKIAQDANKAAKLDSAIDCQAYNDSKKLQADLKKGYACIVKTDEKSLGPCTMKHGFGYRFGSPCVLIKLNRIFGWEPRAFKPKGGNTASNYIKLMEELALIKKKDDKNKDEGDKRIPHQLKEHIIALFGNEATTHEQRKWAMRGVWVHCAGMNAADREHIGHLEYYPSRSIPGYYFPYRRQEAYQSPFVMVHFETLTPGVLVNVECRGYADNIEVDRTTRTGSVQFEIMVD